jgi:hypothetical protein
LFPWARRFFLVVLLMEVVQKEFFEGLGGPLGDARRGEVASRKKRGGRRRKDGST